jgi:hypothetical protein
MMPREGGMHEGRRTLAGSPGQKIEGLMVSTYILPIGQESQQPQAPCRARRQAHNPTSAL